MSEPRNYTVPRWMVWLVTMAISFQAAVFGAAIPWAGWVTAELRATSVKLESQAASSGKIDVQAEALATMRERCSWLEQRMQILEQRVLRLEPRGQQGGRDQLDDPLAFLPCFAQVEAWPSKPPEGWTTACEVVKIIDGDTLDVEVRKVLRVRLIDCWAPEPTAPGGREAGQWLLQLTRGKRATLSIPRESDSLAAAFSFGRVLGHVWMEGENRSLSELMVAGHHATKTKER